MQGQFILFLSHFSNTTNKTQDKTLILYYLQNSQQYTIGLYLRFPIFP